MSDITGKIWIVYNGEIYNFKEIRKGLEGKGYTFRTDSDTEVIINSYKEYGTECVKKFNGMFSFAVWDGYKKVLFLARDRLGIKPLYYTAQKGNLIFASEVKAILEFPGLDYGVNLNALSSYLTFRTNVQDESFFTNIYTSFLPAILCYMTESIKES
jgi:asparagine synthase (glutamine-hydrolysing)